MHAHIGETRKRCMHQCIARYACAYWENPQKMHVSMLALSPGQMRAAAYNSTMPPAKRVCMSSGNRNIEIVSLNLEKVLNWYINTSINPLSMPYFPVTARLVRAV